MSKVKEIGEIVEFLSKYATLQKKSEEPFHSNTGCQCCSEGIGNTVYVVVGLDVDDNKQELILCTDCINFFFYGETPLYWVRRDSV